MTAHAISFIVAIGVEVVVTLLAAFLVLYSVIRGWTEPAIATLIGLTVVGFLICAIIAPVAASLPGPLW